MNTPGASHNIGLAEYEMNKRYLLCKKLRIEEIQGLHNEQLVLEISVSILAKRSLVLICIK